MIVIKVVKEAVKSVVLTMFKVARQVRNLVNLRQKAKVMISMHKKKHVATTIIRKENIICKNHVIGTGRNGKNFEKRKWR